VFFIFFLISLWKDSLIFPISSISHSIRFDGGTKLLINSKIWLSTKSWRFICCFVSWVMIYSYDSRHCSLDRVYVLWVSLLAYCYSDISGSMSVIKTIPSLKIGFTTGIQSAISTFILSDLLTLLEIFSSSFINLFNFMVIILNLLLNPPEAIFCRNRRFLKMNLDIVRQWVAFQFSSRICR